MLRCFTVTSAFIFPLKDVYFICFNIFFFKQMKWFDWCLVLSVVYLIIC